MTYRTRSADRYKHFCTLAISLCLLCAGSLDPGYLNGQGVATTNTIAIRPASSRAIQNNTVQTFSSSAAKDVPIADLNTGTVGTNQQSGSQQSHMQSEKDLSLGSFDWITGRNVGADGLTQGTTSAAGLLASFHQQMRPFIGYKVNFGWTKFSETYPAVAFSPINSLPFSYRYLIPNDVYEVSSTYVMEQSNVNSRLRTFADVGGGVLMFVPRTPPFSGYSSYRATLIYGAGAEYRINNHWGVLAGYRGLFYKNPDYAAKFVIGLNTTKTFTFSNEPRLSIVYHFGS